MLRWLAGKLGFVSEKEMRARLAVAHQALLEVRHAQECGPSWYTRGEDGLYQQVSMWVRKGLEATRDERIQ